jgi:hypothetical protein
MLLIINLIDSIFLLTLKRTKRERNKAEEQNVNVTENDE